VIVVADARALVAELLAYLDLRVVVAEEQRDETQAVSMAGAERDVVDQALALVLALTAAWTLTVRSPRS
jgi:hypothetical protein